jgi:hypothetical protein
MIDDVELTFVSKKTGHRRTLRVSSLAVAIGLLAYGVLITVAVLMLRDVYRAHGAFRFALVVAGGILLGSVLGIAVGREFVRRIHER